MKLEFDSGSSACGLNHRNRMSLSLSGKSLLDSLHVLLVVYDLDL